MDRLVPRRRRNAVRLPIRRRPAFPGLGDTAFYEVARAACSITLATTPGCETSDRCEALTLVTLAWARLAMNSWAAGVMAWSAVPITSQLGMVTQAGVPEASARAVAAIGRWVAASSAALLADRSLARTYADGLMYASVTLPGDGTKFSAAGVTWVPGNCVLMALMVSPLAGM